jgi:hypothetical protein
MQRGSIKIEAGTLTIHGQAKSNDDRAALEAAAAHPIPGIVRVAAIDVTPPVRDFAWSATKTPNALILDGYAPSPATQAQILGHARDRFPGLVVQDNTRVAPSIPGDFDAAARVGLDQLHTAEVGRARISGHNYSVVVGVARDAPGDQEAASAALRETAASALPPGFNRPSARVTAAPAEVNDRRSVDFLFATDRVRQDGTEMADFGFDRAESLTYGVARVHVPTDHKMGNIELPGARRFLWFTLGYERTDPEKHFIIKDIEVVDKDGWRRLAADRAQGRDALLFVHGYNTSFRDAIFRTAQVIWDLQYARAAILFSWPSRGETLSYEYDRNSALVARTHFIELLKFLQGDAGIHNIHVLAHSMGNLVALDALANQAARR